MKKHNIKPNIHKEEYQTLKQLKKDNTRMVLTADKGVSMVVMDREEYTQKSEELLYQPNYKILQADSTNKYKIMKSNISSDMNKPCWKLAKAFLLSQKLFCCRENNLLA